jgi:hypothetical protein
MSNRSQMQNQLQVAGAAGRSSAVEVFLKGVLAGVVVVPVHDIEVGAPGDGIEAPRRPPRGYLGRGTGVLKASITPNGDDTARSRASEEPCGTVQRDGLDETGIKPILGGARPGRSSSGSPPGDGIEAPMSVVYGEDLSRSPHRRPSK